MKRWKLWVILSLVLSFGAGAVAGIFAEKGFLGRPAPSHKRLAPPSMDRWAKDLGLTAEQQTKIQDIFKKNEERIEALRSDFFKHLREMRAQLKSGIIVLGTAYEDRPLFLTAVTPDLVAKGYNAGDIVRQVAKATGGGGGGKPTLAQAGGKDVTKIDAALALVNDLVNR